ncbi:5,10-methylenetetrahydrofolate reductase [Salicibibacter halophilus]|uniref:Methylenetetrahydrofolate reductase n=1 Tax=Salicibibacter halophilus TaxID=2502791 RepID=A0A514LGY2_9BACI|nr:methylenetetrahydrofolate reductase [Salicibibacter halophilus]QDI91108.1 5,10-methylenetetrahydrofolate reductase [Salicibibacter halophilus]
MEVGFGDIVQPMCPRSNLYLPISILQMKEGMAIMEMMDRQSSAERIGRMNEPRFELIPANRIVERATAALPPHATLTVTCSPKKGVDATIDTAIALAPRFAGVVPHIGARMVRSEKHLEGILDKLRINGLEEIFVIGSDQKQPLGPYRYGFELLRSLATRDHGLRRIGIPAYPEGHPNINNDILAEDLLVKAPFVHYAVSQMCFDSDQVLAWLRQQREAGLQLPVYLGIPGPVKPDKLLRIAANIGVTDSLRFLRKNLKLSGKLLHGYDASGLMNAYTPHLNESDYGIAGFHIYTFNELVTLKKTFDRVAT